MDKGVGLVCLHYAVEVPKGEPGDKFLDWLGGYYETGYSTNPHWTAEIKSLPEHPITRGVKPFAISDEWYFNIRFRPEMKGVTPILVAKPDDETRQGVSSSPARPVQAHRRGQGPRRGPRLGRRAARRRPRLRLHRRPLPQELGRPQLPQARPERHPLDRRARRPLTGVESQVTAEELKQNLDPK